MQTHRRCVIILTILFTAVSLSAEEKDNGLPVVNFENGSIEAEYLPYGRKFKIEGSATSPSGPADIVTMVIQDKTTPDSVWYYLWEQPKETASGNFSIVVNNPLEFDHDYCVTVKFYVRFSPAAAETAGLVQAVVNRSISAWDDKTTVSDSKIKSFFQEEVVNFLNGYPSAKRPMILQVDREKRRVVETTDIAYLAPVVISQADINAIRGYGPTAAQSKELIEKFNRAQAALNDAIAHEATGRLVEHLEAAMKQKTNPVTYSIEDVRSLLAGSGISVGLPPGMEFLVRDDPPPYPPAITRDDIVWLDTLFQRRLRYKHAKENLDENIRQLAAFRVVFQRATLVIENAFMESLSYAVHTYTFTSKQHLDAIRIGTTYGIGLAGLNMGWRGTVVPWDSSSDASVFQYAGLKFFLGAVDKELRDPYLSWSSRFAVTIGFVTASQLEYQGKVLDDAGGFKPMLGLSWDADRYITLEAGAVFFRQKVPSDLSTQTRVRVAPYGGIGFDFNVFNRIRGLIKSGGG